MVVKRSKNLENIYDSLDNLMMFFSSVEGGNSDPKILAKVASVLLTLEQDLKVSTNNYRPPRKEIEPN